MAKKRISLDVDGREVSVSSPDKIYFPDASITKLEVVGYYRAVMAGALHHLDPHPHQPAPRP